MSEPELVGQANPNVPLRIARILVRSIDAYAQSTGLDYRLRDHVMIIFRGTPKIPKRKRWRCLLVAAEQYLRACEASTFASEIKLLSDKNGSIWIEKSYTHPRWFSFRFES